MRSDLTKKSYKYGTSPCEKTPRSYPRFKEHSKRGLKLSYRFATGEHSELNRFNLPSSPASSGFTHRHLPRAENNHHGANHLNQRKALSEDQHTTQ